MREELPKIKFNDFKKLYENNSNKWSLYNTYVVYDTTSGRFFGEKYYLSFSCTDYIKYRFWNWRKNVNDKKKNRIEMQNKILEILAPELEKIELAQRKSQGKVLQFNRKG